MWSWALMMRPNLGQWPYAATRVFNFYLVDFKPSDTIADVHAPEFEIFTAPFAIGWANAVLELIEDGLSFCGDGLGVPVQRCNVPRFNSGKLNFTAGVDLNKTLAELDVLLTGGRLSSSAAVIREAYENADEHSKLQAAQKAILMSPEFHTLGATDTTGERTTTTTTTTVAPSGGSTASSGADDYKALIMLYLKGGQDSFNMLVPLGQRVVSPKKSNA